MQLSIERRLGHRAADPDAGIARKGAVALEDLADVVETGIKRVLTVIEHPLSQDAAAADDAGDTTLHLGQGSISRPSGWFDGRRPAGGASR